MFKSMTNWVLMIMALCMVSILFFTAIQIQKHETIKRSSDLLQGNGKDVYVIRDELRKVTCYVLYDSTLSCVADREGAK